jgi:ribosomal protein S18 acetylase RimI-like enzyme
MLIYTRKKTRLLRHFRKDPVLFAYHIGDLDDFFFEHSQFAGAYEGSHVLKDVILVYTGLETANVITFGLTDAIYELLDDLIPLLPDRFYSQFFSEYRGRLRETYGERPLGTHFKMKLVDYRPVVDSSADITRLNRSNVQELREFYSAAYPGSYFGEMILDTEKFFGCKEQGKLVAVAGVHVYSREYKIGVLGSIATHPDFRGRRLASQVTCRLIDDLKNDVDLICLNVKADNAPAVRCYEKLGFVKTHEFEEALFEKVK